MRALCILLLTAIPEAMINAQGFSYNQASETRGIKTFAERVTLDITPVKTKVLEERETVLPVIGALAAPLLQVGISAVKANLAKSAKQYMANYACSNSGDRFYDSRQNVNLPELTIRRSITIPDKISGGTRIEDALILVLTPELSADKRAFRYRVKLVNMSYSKARTRFGYDYLDVQLDVVFRALTLEGAKQEVVNLRAFSLVIPGVRPNNAYDVAPLPYSSWLPFPPPPQVTKGVGSYDGTGSYEFLIGVTESNPYKVSAEHKQYLVENSSDALDELAEQIAALIKTPAK